mmetsp:Transcript_6410/g.21433  ORF Transcript_6410/g.21433 Transcript_6410/m.21433 type:complete len:235 (+) Transcript_6410:2786-3490(+)
MLYRRLEHHLRAVWGDAQNVARLARVLELDLHQRVVLRRQAVNLRKIEIPVHASAPRFDKVDHERLFVDVDGVHHPVVWIPDCAVALLLRAREPLELAVVLWREVFRHGGGVDDADDTGVVAPVEVAPEVVVEFDAVHLAEVEPPLFVLPYPVVGVKRLHDVELVAAVEELVEVEPQERVHRDFWEGRLGWLVVGPPLRRVQRSRIHDAPVVLVVARVLSRSLQALLERWAFVQ